MEFGEAARGRPPGPGLVGAQLKGHPDRSTLVINSSPHALPAYHRHCAHSQNSLSWGGIGCSSDTDNAHVRYTTM